MDRFSEAYDKAKSVVKSSAFAGEVEKLRGKLKQLMGDDGPSSGETATLDKLRETIEVEQSAEFINGKNSTKPKAHADTIIKASAGSVGRANRAATLKMLYHLYHGKTTGSSVIWVYSPPKVYSKWIYDEVSSDGEDAIRTALMKDATEVYSEDERKMMCDAVQTARKVVMDAAAKLATPDTATKAKVKQYFADSTTTEEQLTNAMSTLSSGYTKIAGGLNSNLLIMSDEPGDRTGGGWKDWAFIYPTESMKVIYLQGAWLAKAGEATPSNQSPLYRCARTLIHEMSHKEVRTEDIVYGPKGLKPEGSSALTGAYALHNADSWAYFAVDVVGQLTGPDKDNGTKVCEQILKTPVRTLTP